MQILSLPCGPPPPSHLSLPAPVLTAAGGGIALAIVITCDPVAIQVGACDI